MYFILPFIGAGISTVFYLIIRGGLMSGVAEYDNVFGLMAIGTLVGLFSPQALEKLKNVSEIIFNKPEANRHGKDAYFQPPLEVEGVEPPEGGENQPVTILGKGFVKGKVRVRFGDKAAKVAKVEDQEITVTTPENPSGKVKVFVIHDGACHEAPGGFTYKNEGPPSENKPGDIARPPSENKPEDNDE